MNSGTATSWGDFKVSNGKLVTINPVSGAAPNSGAIPESDGATLGVVLFTTTSSTPGAPPFAKVQLIAPGKPNDRRHITVPAHTVAD